MIGLFAGTKKFDRQHLEHSFPSTQTRREKSGFLLAFRTSAVCAALTVILFLPFSGFIPAVLAAGGHITGTVLVRTDGATVAYGDWIRVLLVSEKVDVPDPGGLSGLHRQERIDRMIHLHLDFFKNIQSRLNDPGYLIADTLTTPDGGFKFYGIAPGRYYLVVTFPSMIKGYKVAWQMAVQVVEGQTRHIELNNANMAVPTYSR